MKDKDDFQIQTNCDVLVFDVGVSEIGAPT
jgi:hypothetical protein